MNNFICPICKNALKLDNRSLKCINKHCFDLAKEGYVNLLPVNSKKSKDPGDNSKMMVARRAFLETKHYLPLAKKLAEIVENISGNTPMTVLDIGCGEGYYTGLIKSHNTSVHMLGLDISKVAVRYASKRYKDVHFCVASAYDLPVENKAIDILLRVFAPSSASELQRVVKDDGFLITVTPGERHLYQLREVIYKDVRNHFEETALVQGFKLENSINLKYSLSLKDLDTVLHLLDMTPFGWKIGDEEKTKLMKMSHWDIDCEFNIEIYRKDS